MTINETILAQALQILDNRDQQLIQQINNNSQTIVSMQDSISSLQGDVNGLSILFIIMIIVILFPQLRSILKKQSIKLGSKASDLTYKIMFKGK